MMKRNWKFVFLSMCTILIFSVNESSAEPRDILLEFSIGHFRNTGEVTWPQFILRYDGQGDHDEDVDESTLNSYNVTIGVISELYPQIDTHLRFDVAYFPAIEIDYSNSHHRVKGTYEGTMIQYGYALGLSYLFLPREKSFNIYLAGFVSAGYSFFEGNIEVETIEWDKKNNFIIPELGLSFKIDDRNRFNCSLQYRYNFNGLEMSGPALNITYLFQIH